jgi:phospholipid N-methyltransferase
MASTIAGLGLRSLRKLQSRTADQQSSLQQAGLFFRNFIRHPLMLGSAIPSSRYLINRILDRVDWTSVRTAIEYGPGVGTFTRPMLSRMTTGAKLLAVELNQDFSFALREQIDDSRLLVQHGSAIYVNRWMRSKGLASADLVLSGIPYTVLPRELRLRILRETRKALAAEGVFAVYQYTRAVLPDLQEVFGSVEEDFEPINVLPARIFYCRV